MVDNKKLKFDIENGQVFFADEIGIIHNPLRVIFDFRSVTPRVDVRNQEYQPIVIKHNVVMLDPYTAKSFFEVLEKNLKNYEKQFGKIKKPKQLEKAEKSDKGSKKSKKGGSSAPIYFG